LSLVRNTEVDGVIQQGQHDYAIMKILNGVNNFYESHGTGNKILTTYKDEKAFTGDPTIKAQVKTATDLPGGRVRLSWTTDTYDAFRQNDDVDVKFGAPQYQVTEKGPGYVILRQRDGYSAPSASLFPTGVEVYVRKRSIDVRGTKSPEGLYPVFQPRYNYVSTMDDAQQQNLFDAMNQTVLTQPQGQNYISIAPVHAACRRFLRYQLMTFFTSRKVNPEDNGFRYSATAGIHQQIEEGGTFIPQNTLLTRSEFESRLRNWLVANPGGSNQNRFIGTGSIGYAMVSEWYKDYLKYDRDITITFTDGSVNGLNATKIFIPGFEPLSLVKMDFLDIDWMGRKSSIPGFTQLPQTSGNFYLMDFNPVYLEPSGSTMPAFQKFYLRHKYFYAFQQGLAPMEYLGEVLANRGLALTEETARLTSTDNDFNNFRIYSLCGINIVNPQAQTLIENRV